jgi:hypothetical protein
MSNKLWHIKRLNIIRPKVIHTSQPYKRPDNEALGKNINGLYWPYLILLPPGSIGTFTTFKLKLKPEV